jgi:hypothetical protein
MATQFAPERPVAGQQTDQTVGALPLDPTAGTLVALRRRRRIDRAHLIMARLILGGIAIQVFFAGLGIFTATGFLPHMVWGPLVILASFSLPALAHLGRLERAVVVRSWLLAGLMVLQGLLIDVGRVFPVVAALHPVNAMALVLVAFLLATRHVE